MIRVTLAELKRRHDAYAAPGERTNTRLRARDLAKRLGVPEPAWAACLCAADRKASQRQAGHAWEAPKPRGPGRGAPVDATAIERLRAWRLANPGAVVQVSRDGVRLHEIGRVRRFPSVDAALAAVA